MQAFQDFGWAQTQKPDLEKFRQQTDSLYQLALKLCSEDSTKKKAWTWVLKSNTLSAVLDDAFLKEKYKNQDLHLELSQALNNALSLDQKKEYQTATQNELASNTIDISNLALEAVENARRYKSKEDAERAIQLITITLENYKETGKSQKLVDKFWAEEKLDWRWLRFYKAVCLRLSGQTEVAEKEYGTLYKMGWNEPTLLLEYADFQAKNGKIEESGKILENGAASHPENADLACDLTLHYLERDQIKNAQSTIKKLDPVLGMNSKVAMTKALVYEKKGNFKKADALFKAVYKADQYEVETNRIYAGYLLRKAASADKMDAEEFAQEAYNLLAKAIDLAPGNENLKSDWEKIKVKYPKVTKIEETE
jgi:Flp pilus assembly protein TadD